MKLGRNDPCSCGSGKKYKNCCQGKVESRSFDSRLQVPTQDELNQLIALFNAGRYVELENRALLLIKQYPSSGFVWMGLGLSLQMQGKDALPALQKTAELMPDDAAAHNNLANTLRERGQLESSEASCRRALKINPNFAEAHSNLGLALLKLGQLDGAVAGFRRALQIKPDFADAHSNLGYALKELGQFDKAVASCRRALELKPDFADAHTNLGNALKEIGQLEDAVTSYLLALKIKPDFAEAHNNLGNALKDLGRLNDAKASYLRALKIKPDFADSHFNMGCVLTDIGHLDEAAASYRRALELKPDFINAQSSLLFILNYTAKHAPAFCMAEAKQYGQMVARKVTARFSKWRCPAKPERLRVGLVSGDFLNHPVGFFLEGLLAHIDPARIELVAYPTHHKEDELTARIRPYFSKWKSLVGKSDEAAAHLIHADSVHVLLDIAGHTSYNRLPVFAWKPAPVQAMWLGYFATTGIAEMDYILGDKWTLPDGEEHNFVEKGWRLSGAQWCMTPPKEDIKVAELPALRNQSITFGTLNNIAKMNARVVACWARILSEMPNSRLYLNIRNLHNDALMKNVIEWFAAHGIAENRLILETTSGRVAALNSYNKIDIALDPFPYPGGTTSYEALWMGVPILTMRGSTYLSHLGESIMHNAGLPEWIAADEEDYIAKAVAFGSNLADLANLRSSLRARVLASPLFDATLFARSFEEALWGMWQARIQPESSGDPKFLTTSRD